MQQCVRWTSLFRVILLAAAVVMPGLSQNASSSVDEETTFTGTVVSTTRNTLTVRNSGGRYQLFLYDKTSVRPSSLSTGSEVEVTSVSSDEPGVRVVRRVNVTRSAAAPTAGSSSPAPAVPPEVRRIERQIERQAKRYQAGVRAGVALDPELVLIGVHAQVGPFFSPDVFLRPNVEFAYGEVTALFALNLEAIYRLPVSSRAGGWSTYVGVGPGFNFLHQNFTKDGGGGSRIDFGEFKSDVGLNILGGLRYRSGMFMELKTTVYSDPSPTLRMIVGYNF